MGCWGDAWQGYSFPPGALPFFFLFLFLFFLTWRDYNFSISTHFINTLTNGCSPAMLTPSRGICHFGRQLFTALRPVMQSQRLGVGLEDGAARPTAVHQAQN